MALRTARNLGLAAWFGGSLMGAVGLNGTAARASDRVAAATITSTGWSRWTPIGFATIGLHLVGALGGTVACGSARAASGPSRGSHLDGRPVTIAITAAAMIASTYSYVVGKQIQHAALDQPNAATEAGLTPERRRRLLRAERGLGVAQWAVPTLTAVLILLYARDDATSECRGAEVPRRDRVLR